MSVELLAPAAIAIEPTPQRVFEGPAGTSLKRTVSAYVELTKPRLVLLVLMTTAVGFWLGARGRFDVVAFLVALAGTGLVGGAACAWNQIVERDRDARMKRTARRPLPSGRAALVPGACFATVLLAAGLGALWWLSTAAALVALATFVLYVCVYTPLKPRTTLNTAVGAVPGALPPLIGWAAAGAGLGTEAWTLFLIVFLWQFPHFLAIAWIYRDDYERAGMRMLPGVDRSGRLTSLQACATCALLIPAGLLPWLAGVAGPFYAAGALVAGLFYLKGAARFAQSVGDASARRLLRASFVYLPVILILLLLNTAR